MRFKIVKLLKQYAKGPNTQCVAVFDEPGHRWVPLKPLVDNFSCSFLEENVDLQFDMLSILCEYKGIKLSLENILREASDFDFQGYYDEDFGVIPFTPKTIRKRSMFEDYEVQKRRKFYEKKKRLRHFVYTKLENFTNKIPGQFIPGDDFYFSPNFSYENSLNIYPSGSVIAVPECVSNLDFEGGVGVVFGNSRDKDNPVRNISPEDAKDYIIGFAVVSHVVSLNTQVRKVEEMSSEIFGTSISSEIATPDEVFPFFHMVKNEFRINGELINEGSSLYSVFQPEELLSFASEGTNLYTGELLSLSSFPNCGGFVNGKSLKMDDNISFLVRNIGEVTTQVGERDGITHWKRRRPIVHYFKFYRYQIGFLVALCLIYLLRKRRLRKKKAQKKAISSQ